MPTAINVIACLHFAKISQVHNTHEEVKFIVEESTLRIVKVDGRFIYVTDRILIPKFSIANYALLLSRLQESRHEASV